jgi:signal transduction histidine kinase
MQDAAGVSLMEQCYPDPRYRQRVQEFMQSCRDGWLDIRMRTRDGRDLETSWANVRLSDGTQVGIGIDITDRKRYEDSLRDADRRKDEFLATLAHELRNPLAPLRNGLQLIKLAGDKAEAVEQARGMMERQLAQMVRLIDDLLDVSRITRGKLQLRRERVELASVIQSAVEGSRPLIKASAHQLTIRIPPEPVLLDADPTRLAQVFGNLLTNAAKYTEKGGHIWLTAERQGGEIAVSVKDTGIGIAAEHLPRLFEMFSQATPALERSQGGLGIGLSLVQGLVEMHGGSVEARSEGPGKGSEFIVRLPVAGGTTRPESRHGHHGVAGKPAWSSNAARTTAWRPPHDRRNLKHPRGPGSSPGPFFRLEENKARTPELAEERFRHVLGVVEKAARAAPGRGGRASARRSDSRSAAGRRLRGGCAPHGRGRGPSGTRRLPASGRGPRRGGQSLPASCGSC